MRSTQDTRLEPTAARRSPSAGVVALVMGIVGLVALPVIGSVLALVFGYQARREALTRPDVYSDDLARAGRILGWVGVALVTAGLIALLLGVLFLMPLSVGSA
jgi:uncharacterized membrane protein